MEASPFKVFVEVEPLEALEYYYVVRLLTDNQAQLRGGHLANGQLRRSGYLDIGV
jgi:hypothetical protein